MNMNKTELEFVAFDAQDVIATSGEFSGLAMYITGTLFAAFNPNRGSDPALKNQNGGSSYSPNKIYFYLTDDTKAEKSYSNVTALKEDTSFDATIRESAVQLTTSAEIHKWLAENNLLNQ